MVTFPTRGSTGPLQYLRRWLSGRLGLLVLSLLLAGLCAWLLVTQAGASRQAGYMGGIFVLAGLLWVSEALPLFATALLVIGLQAVFLANPGHWPGLGFEGGPSPSFRQVLAAAADPILLLFFGGFVLAHAATRTGVDRGMSVLLLRPFGYKPKWVLLYRFYPPLDKGLRLVRTHQKLTGRGWFVVIVFVITVLLWMSDPWHGLPAAAVAMLPIIAFTTSGVFTRHDLGQIDWSVLILIAGGISLGSGMQLIRFLKKARAFDCSFSP